MPHAETFDALVLKTYDIGEADRLCILFTRERGRIPAKASGARRPGSRLGGALLPFRRVSVQVRESSKGWVVTGALMTGCTGNTGNQGFSLPQFMALEEGVELLLRFVSEEGPLPEVFDATAEFVLRSHQPHAVLAYSFALLHCLGLLPEDGYLTDIMRLSGAERLFIAAARRGALQDASGCRMASLQRLRDALLTEHLSSPLKTRTMTMFPAVSPRPPR